MAIAVRWSTAPTHDAELRRRRRRRLARPVLFLASYRHGAVRWPRARLLLSQLKLKTAKMSSMQAVFAGYI